MKGLAIALPVFYLLVFVFVKAQEISLQSSDYIESANSSNVTGMSFFVIALFLLSIISFSVFWMYKDYLISALKGEFKPDDISEEALNAQTSAGESIGEHEAKLISEVDIYDVTDDNKEHSDTYATDTSTDELVKDTDQKDEKVVSVHTPLESKTESEDKPNIYIEIVSGNPQLVIK